MGNESERMMATGQDAIVDDLWTPKARGKSLWPNGPCRVCGQKNVTRGRKYGVYLCNDCKDSEAEDAALKFRAEVSIPSGEMLRLAEILQPDGRDLVGLPQYDEPTVVFRKRGTFTDGKKMELRIVDPGHGRQPYLQVFLLDYHNRELACLPESNDVGSTYALDRYVLTIKDAA